MKLCPKCKVLKDTDDFNKCSRRPDGLNGWCKDCHKIYRENNKLRRQKGNSTRLTNIRNTNILKIMAIVGNKCVDCSREANKDNFHIFDLHHLDPKEKDHSVRTDSKWSSKIEEEVKKCILLCSCCHRDRHFKEKH